MATELKFSDQAIGAVMMALQKCILEQSDITDILRGFKLKNSEVGLMVLNPSIVKFNYAEEGDCVNIADDSASE